VTNRFCSAVEHLITRARPGRQALRMATAEATHPGTRLRWSTWTDVRTELGDLPADDTDRLPPPPGRAPHMLSVW